MINILQMTYVDQIFELLQKYSQQEIADLMGVTDRTIQNYVSQEPTKPHPKTLRKIDEIYQKLILEGRSIETMTLIEPEAQGFGVRVRKPKTEDNPENEGIDFIDIAAQAGYPKKITDPMFKSSLKKIFIPGMPYRGEDYRIWEVEGNSMEPTFKEGYHLLSEKVEPQFWMRPKQYHAYVIVTEEDVLLKRIAISKTKPDHYVLHSDNELYPEFLFPIELVKELWFVRRKMDWEMAPPKKFDSEL